MIRGGLSVILTPREKAVEEEKTAKGDPERQKPHSFLFRALTRRVNLSSGHLPLLDWRSP